MTSRIKRWTGADFDDAPAHRADDAVSDPRIAQALRTALAALQAARAKLERADRRRRVRAGAEAVVGLAGLGGLVSMLVSIAPQPNLVGIGLLSVAAMMPIFAAFTRATTDGRRESEEVAAVETARTVAVQAAGLARTLEVATRPNQGGPAAAAVASEVVAHIEQTAAALEGRERRTDVEHGPKARRHVRIKPVNDRIAVTTEAGMTFIAQLVDVSISGAMIAGRLPDARIGDEIRVGSRPAMVVRIAERGFACEFIEPLPPQSLAPNLVL